MTKEDSKMNKTTTVTLNLKRPFWRYNARITSVHFLVPLIILLVSGCPVGDPYTESRIVNKTAKEIQIELILDNNKYGLEKSDATIAYAQEWLEEFNRGEGVKMLAIDTAGLSATYQISASGFLIAHASLGRKPYFYFKKLIIRQDNKSLIFNSEQEIAKLFQITDTEYQYKYQITDAIFNESDVTRQEEEKSVINSVDVAETFNLLDNESLGRLRIGLSESQVRTVVQGKPQKGENIFWGANGEYGQQWHYPAQGLTLQMMSSTLDGEKVIGSINIMAPSILKSQLGIEIGSTEANVLKAYGKYRATNTDDFSEPGRVFVAGSIYGGMVFTLYKGKVSEIFLGAASE